MIRSERLPVVLLWHMHQPQYRDALSGRYVLPWTYLHAIKDYTDMAAHLEANPRARAVVNFTPVLLEQLEDLRYRVAEHLRSGAPLPDPVLGLLGPAPITQEPGERLALMRACLRAQRKHMIERFGPYLELAMLAESFATAERVVYASDQFMQDLAMWYHLAWLGETVRRSDPRVEDLMDQGRGFDARQRRELLVIISELLDGVVPRFRRLRDSGQCELSVSPYAHPILPLLIDFRAAREALPEASLPRHPAYPGGAERAAWHVEESIRVFTHFFGEPPQGCWPSEGAMSRPSLDLLDRFGFRWAASSSGVLRGSLEAAGLRGSNEAYALYRPRTLPGQRMTCVFRDDMLSDLIGFNYATWHGDDAARNFVHELAQIAQRHNRSTGDMVLIALDGENAWEHYPFNAYYFLRALYAELSQHPALELTTLSEAPGFGLQPLPLAQVRAGSWVHGTLATWMGDPAKNAAWDLLCEAKIAFDRTMSSRSLDPQQRAAAQRQLALCESSDWFWWFGDYNPHDAVSQFDRLYRHQLVNLYRMLGLPAPESLSHPISTGHGAPEHGGVMRRASAG